MKEIKYDGVNLKDNIDKSRNYNMYQAYIVKILGNLFGFGIACLIGFIIINNLGFLLFCIGTALAVDTFFIRKEIKNWHKEQNLANKALSDLSYRINEEDDITLSNDNFRNSVIIESRSFSKSNYLQESENVNSVPTSQYIKSKKIIRYFYMLDKNDKLAVLKQITETIKKNKSSETKQILYLLESEDLEKLNIPVEKKLVPKKRQ